MDRSEYLRLCQRYAITKEKPPDLLVEYNGMKYFPKEYSMKFDRLGNTLNIAVLEDINLNSILCVDLERVSFSDN
jgi:hypothetical protein